jgi:hypothetical protein
MNKKLTIASALLAASAAFAGLNDGVFDLWKGSDGLPQVLTGIGNESETAGYWFSYDDSGDKGGSKVIWADGTVELGNGDSPDALDNVILWCNGVCGTAVLDKGKLSYNPFVGIGFNVVGEIAKGEGNPQPGDASAWGGVCITYKSGAAPALELGLGDEVDASIEYANPAAQLPKSTDGTMKQLVWTDFKQPTWYKGTTKMSGPDASKQLVALKFKIQAQSGEYPFNICAIGPNGAACPETCEEGGDIAIKAVRGASAAKAILSGRTLSFSGVKAGAVEVLNLQGQVVAKGEVSSALSLANLDAGVYMVRGAGKVNFTNKIVLK